MKLRDIARAVGGTIEGDGEIEIGRVAAIRDALPGDISFLANKRYVADVADTSASALVVATDFKVEASGITLLRASDPYFAFCQVIKLFHSGTCTPTGIDPTASVSPDARLGAGLSIFPFVYIADGAEIGDRVTLYPGVFVGEGSRIGDDAVIYPNVTIREGCVLGKRVIVHSGTVIGSDGFGYATKAGVHHKIPQVGGVSIGDDVEIGANVTIDRAALGMTRIEKGVKIDNLVQIAHNVVIGEGCIVVAQVGIAGSTELGKYVVLAGQAGLVGHIKLADGVRVGAQSGVMNDIKAGETVSGTPALPHKEWLKASAVFSHLPEMRKEITALKKELSELEARLEEG